MRTLWEDVLKTCPGIKGSVEQFAAGRHAPVAERAVRALREGFNACLIHMRDHGVGLRYQKNAYTFLYQHVCQARTRHCLVAASAATAQGQESGTSHVRFREHGPDLRIPV